MADPTKDQDSKPLYDADLPDDQSDEELDESAEAQGDEDESEFEAAGAAAAPASRRFGFGRGTEEHEGEKHPMGSLRDSHERVRIDDRPSAIYALLCAAVLIGVLAVAWLGGVVPQSAGPTLSPLSVPTSQATPSSAASAAVSATPSATVTAAPSPSASLSAAPSN